MGARNYGPYEVLSAGDMAGSLNSAGVDMLTMPFGAAELVWTGAPVGTFSVDASIQNVTSADLVTRWYPTGTDVAAPAGSASSTLVNLAGMGFRWLRISYARVSGTGALTITVFGKGGFSG